MRARWSLAETQCQTSEASDWIHFRARLSCDAPTEGLHTGAASAYVAEGSDRMHAIGFDASLTIERSTTTPSSGGALLHAHSFSSTRVVPVTAENLLQRSMYICNSPWLVAMVVYSGRSLLSFDAMRRPFEKKSMLEPFAKLALVIQTVLLVVGALVCSLGWLMVYERRRGFALWMDVFLCTPGDSSPGCGREGFTTAHNFFEVYLWGLILLHQVVSLSLFPILEVTRCCRAWRAERDLTDHCPLMAAQAAAAMRAEGQQQPPHSGGSRCPTTSWCRGSVRCARRGRACVCLRTRGVTFADAFTVSQPAATRALSQALRPTVRAPVSLEALGRVRYAFFDKTGTLTTHRIKAEALSVGGTIYRLLPHEEAVGPTSNCVLPSPHRSARNAGVTTETTTGATVDADAQDAATEPAVQAPAERSDLLAALRNFEHPRSALAWEMLACVAMCHTVVPVPTPLAPDTDIRACEYQPNTVTATASGVTYYGRQPEEVALVVAAQQCGFVLTNRTQSQLTFDVMGVPFTMDVLLVNEFSPHRRRMSILLRRPDGVCVLYVKGADISVLPRIRDATPDVTSDFLVGAASAGYTGAAADSGSYKGAGSIASLLYRPSEMSAQRSDSDAADDADLDESPGGYVLSPHSSRMASQLGRSPPLRALTSRDEAAGMFPFTSNARMHRVSSAAGDATQRDGAPEPTPRAVELGASPVQSIAAARPFVCAVEDMAVCSPARPTLASLTTPPTAHLGSAVSFGTRHTTPYTEARPSSIRVGMLSPLSSDTLINGITFSRRFSCGGEAPARGSSPATADEKVSPVDAAALRPALLQSLSGEAAATDLHVNASRGTFAHDVVHSSLPGAVSPSSSCTPQSESPDDTPPHPAPLTITTADRSRNGPGVDESALAPISGFAQGAASWIERSEGPHDGGSAASQSAAHSASGGNSSTTTQQAFDTRVSTATVAATPTARSPFPAFHSTSDASESSAGSRGADTPKPPPLGGLIFDASVGEGFMTAQGDANGMPPHHTNVFDATMHFGVGLRSARTSVASDYVGAVGSETVADVASTLGGALATAERRAVLKEVENHLDTFAAQGMRTFTFARRFVEPAHAEAYVQQQASLLSSDAVDTNALEEFADAMEDGLELLGGCALRDTLHANVAQTCEALNVADVRVWMVTGDKLETSISVGLSSGLLHDSMDVVQLRSVEVKNLQASINTARISLEERSAWRPGS
ncbi:hypothetical protein EON66_01690, partial [archaeon]